MANMESGIGFFEVNMAFNGAVREHYVNRTE